MSKMKKRNEQLQQTLGEMPTKERVKEVINMPKEDTVNRQGFKTYSLEDELRLVSMLNTLKLEPQFYRSENEIMKELRDIIERISMKDPYFVAQAIKWSRCMGEGMRSINHLAAVLLASFISGEEFAKRFYSLYDKKTQLGGCIFRPDDMSEIKDAYSAMNKSVLSNAMKKGFASVIENMDAYQMSKYKHTVIDIANLVHPNSSRSKATITVVEKDENGNEIKVEKKILDELMHGVTISADTWETAQSEAGQIVADAVKAGKISSEEAEVVLKEAKNQNWKELLKEGKLGILAALRNIRNMMIGDDKEVMELLAKLVSNGELLRKGKIMPYQIDTAYEIIRDEFPSHHYYGKITDALIKGYEKSVSNLKEALPGKTCVMIDCSGSMTTRCYNGNKSMRNATACEKAGLIAATIAKATGADIIQFGSSAHFYKYDSNMNVFALGDKISYPDMGGTCIGSAFELIRKERKVYDRIILLSDNECNSRYGNRWVSDSYKQYVHDVCSPYVYAVDLAAYGTVPLKNDNKVNYYYGYGYAMFDDISSKEFNPSMHIDKIRKVVI